MLTTNGRNEGETYYTLHDGNNVEDNMEVENFEISAFIGKFLALSL